MLAPRDDSLNSLSTQDLLQEIRSGSRDAWAVLYGRYHILLLLSVRKRLPNHVRLTYDSEDILQSAFLRAWGKVQGFQYRGEGSFRRWLGRIVANNALEKVRRTSAERGNLPVDPIRSGQLDWVADRSTKPPSEVMSSAEEEARLLYCLERLPDELRNIIVLREFESKGWDEIATIMGRANSTVRIKYRSGWLQLSRCMAAESE